MDRRLTSWLFTNAAKELNSGPLRTTPAGSQERTRTHWVEVHSQGSVVLVRHYDYVYSLGSLLIKLLHSLGLPLWIGQTGPLLTLEIACHRQTLLRDQNSYVPSGCINQNKYPVKMMNTSTMIPCWCVSWRELTICKLVCDFFDLKKISHH